jgi:hypothetical protein
MQHRPVASFDAVSALDIRRGYGTDQLPYPFGSLAQGGSLPGGSSALGVGPGTSVIPCSARMRKLRGIDLRARAAPSRAAASQPLRHEGEGNLPDLLHGPPSMNGWTVSNDHLHGALPRPPKFLSPKGMRYHLKKREPITFSRRGFVTNVRWRMATEIHLSF